MVEQFIKSEKLNDAYNEIVTEEDHDKFMKNFSKKNYIILH